MAITKVIDADFPDPCVLYAGGEYHAWATQGAGIANIQHRTSADMVTWSASEEALPTLPAWSEAGYTWAPEVSVIAGKYVMYYTARYSLFGTQSIGVALADTADGPFTAVGTGPIVTGQQYGGAIDSVPFADTDGRSYVLYNAGGPDVGHIYGSRTRCKGLGLRGRPQDLFHADQTWEGGNVEAPSLVRNGSTYILFYSGKWYDDAGYAVGYCTASNAMGPYTKQTTSSAWLVTTGSYSGPGGQHPFVDASGNQKMVFHAWDPGYVGYPSGGHRSMWLGSLNLNTMVLS